MENTSTLRAVGYVRVSTQEQAHSGLGIDAQLASISRAVEHRGWDLVETIADEGVSAKGMTRPGLDQVLSMLDDGGADVLVVAKLDRLTRSMRDLPAFLDRAEAADWSLVLLDVDVDTTTAGGRLVANVMGSVADWERRVISERTKAALAAKKAAGEWVGAPNEQTPENLARVHELHAAGGSLRGVAEQMNAEGRETARGGRWHKATVQRALRAGVPAMAA